MAKSRRVAGRSLMMPIKHVHVTRNSMGAFPCDCGAKESRAGAIHAEQSHFLLETIFNGRELLLLDLPIRESSDRLRVVGHIRRFPPEAIKNDLGTKQSPVTMDIAVN